MSKSNRRRSLPLNQQRRIDRHGPPASVFLHPRPSTLGQDGERRAQVAAVADAVWTVLVNPLRRHAIGVVGLRFVAQPGIEPDRRCQGCRRVHVGEQPPGFVQVPTHDAARCLIKPEQIRALMQACQNDAVGGLLGLPLSDTLKSSFEGRVAATISRADKWLAQTPQMFRVGTLLAALGAAGDAVTDESSAMEAQGLKPLLVRGSAQNFKVTYPEDFALAEAILKNRLEADQGRSRSVDGRLKAEHAC